MQCNYGRWGMSQSTAAVADTVEVNSICSIYCRVRVKGFWFGEIVKRQAHNWQQEFRSTGKGRAKKQDAETVWVRRAEKIDSISCLVYLLCSALLGYCFGNRVNPFPAKCILSTLACVFDAIAFVKLSGATPRFDRWGLNAFCSETHLTLTVRWTESNCKNADRVDYVKVTEPLGLNVWCEDLKLL